MFLIALAFLLFYLYLKEVESGTIPSFISFPHKLVLFGIVLRGKEGEIGRYFLDVTLNKTTGIFVKG